jgi:hypothetical protein
MSEDAVQPDTMYCPTGHAGVHAVVYNALLGFKGMVIEFAGFPVHV